MNPHTPFPSFEPLTPDLLDFTARLARRLTPCAGERDDRAGDAVLHALEHADELRTWLRADPERRDARTWLAAVTRRRFADLDRRAARRPALVLAPPASAAGEAPHAEIPDRSGASPDAPPDTDPCLRALWSTDTRAWLCKRLPEAETADGRTRRGRLREAMERRAGGTLSAFAYAGRLGAPWVARLRLLRPRTRAALLLSADGWPPRRIAEAAGLSPLCVERLIRRARLRIGAVEAADDAPWHTDADLDADLDPDAGADVPSED